MPMRSPFADRRVSPIASYSTPVTLVLIISCVGWPWKLRGWRKSGQLHGGTNWRRFNEFRFRSAGFHLEPAAQPTLALSASSEIGAEVSRQFPLRVRVEIYSRCEAAPARTVGIGSDLRQWVRPSGSDLSRPQQRRRSLPSVLSRLRSAKPATVAEPSRRAAGVEGRSPRGRATRGALTPVSTGSHRVSPAAARRYAPSSVRVLPSHVERSRLLS